MGSNFNFMEKYWPDITQLGQLAELYLYADTNACMIKIGIMAERIARKLCIYEKIQLPEHATQADRIRALKYAQALPQRIDDIFYTLRKAKNDAVHRGWMGPIRRNLCFIWRLPCAAGLWRCMAIGPSSRRNIERRKT